MDIEGSVFADCDLKRADLRIEENRIPPRSARNARFENCDFRGAKLDGWKLDGTTFVHCAFHGATGRPEVLGRISLKSVSVDENAEGTSVDFIGSGWPFP